MTWPLLGGAGVGLGLWLLVRALWQPRPSLAAGLAQLRSASPVPVTTNGQRLPPSRGLEAAMAGIGRSAVRVAEGLGLNLTKARQNLQVVERSLERHMLDKVLYALGGLFLLPAGIAAMALGGVGVPLLVPLWISLLLAVGAFFLPDLALAQAANKRRAAMRHGLSSFLDLVAISLAGGAGVESALKTASEIGQGWAFRVLRERLVESRRRGETPWAGLGRLGEELDVAELRELGASISLAGTEGAKVRESLAAKASTMRMHKTTEAEAEAQAATRNMLLPQALLLMGFLMFLGFPPVMRIIVGIS